MIRIVSHGSNFSGGGIFEASIWMLLPNNGQTWASARHPPAATGGDNPAGCYVGTWPVGTVTLSSSRPPAPPLLQPTTSTTWGRSKRRALLLTLPNRHHPKEGFALVVLRVIKRIDARVQLSRTEELKWTSNHRTIKNVVIKKKEKKIVKTPKSFRKRWIGTVVQDPYFCAYWLC